MTESTNTLSLARALHDAVFAWNQSMPQWDELTAVQSNWFMERAERMTGEPGESPVMDADLIGTPASHTARLRLVWRFLPVEARNAVRPLLLKYLWVLPSWVHELNVEFRAEGDSTASMSSNLSYRTCTLTVYAGWLTECPKQRERLIAHELIHPANAPLLESALEIVNMVLEEDTPAHKLATERLRVASEGATVDWERAVSGICRPPPPFFEEEDEQAPAVDQLEKKGQITSTG